MINWWFNDSYKHIHPVGTWLYRLYITTTLTIKILAFCDIHESVVGLYSV